MPLNIIPFPLELRLRLPTIVGNVDFLVLNRALVRMDALLIQSSVEARFVTMALERLPLKERELSASRQLKLQARYRRAIRCNVLRVFLQLGFREFSRQLASCPLYQWFCQIAAMDRIRVPSKSDLERFSKMLSATQMLEIHNLLLKNSLEQPKKLRLKEKLDMEKYFLDTTCLKANIHFPVDWVLLRDGVITLMKATRLIRDQGLKARMEEPEEFRRKINRLSIEMTHQRRKKDSNKGRKKVFRKIKKLVKTVMEHAQTHRELLKKKWNKTEWSQLEADQVLGRMNRTLELLPKARKQAHERIIGGRQVINAEKILSLHETEARVIVRGKAGAEVEFGNTILLGENSQGLILDYRLFKEQAPADSQLLAESLKKIKSALGRKVGAATADRGFCSKANQEALKEMEIVDGLCPKAPKELKKKMKGKKFRALQKRRAQTEGRIGILKANFFGKPMRAKGFEHREMALAWGILTHNLWKLARMVKTKRNKRTKDLLLKAA